MGRGNIIKLRKYLYVNGEVALHKNFLFWLATLSPIFIALCLAYPLSDGLGFSGTVKGYANFTSIFKLPLWIASGSLILGIMVRQLAINNPPL